MQLILENTTMNTWMTENLHTTQLSVARWKKLQSAEYIRTLNKDVEIYFYFVYGMEHAVHVMKIVIYG